MKQSFLRLFFLNWSPLCYHLCEKDVLAKANEGDTSNDSTEISWFLYKTINMPVW